MGAQALGQCHVNVLIAAAVGLADHRQRWQLILRQRGEEIGEHRPIDIDGRQRFPAQTPSAGQPLVEQAQHVQHPCFGLAGVNRIQAVLGGKELAHAGRKLPFRLVVGQGALRHHQSVGPAEAHLAANFVGQAKAVRPLRSATGNQRRRRRQPLGKDEDFDPARAQRLVLEGHHGDGGVPRPGSDGAFLIALALGTILACQPLDVEDALGGFGPRTGHAAQAGHTQPGCGLDLLDGRKSRQTASPKSVQSKVGRIQFDSGQSES